MIETKNSVHVKYRLRDARRYKVNYSVMEDIKTLTNISKQSSISTENAQETAHIINRYFGEHKRDQAFRQIEGVISVRFKELLEQFDFNNGVIFSTSYYLFCYTLTDPTIGYQTVQNNIYSNVAVPFKKWVENKGALFTKLINDIKEGDDYLFICRRAVVSGNYAPGKSIYTYAEALLARGENVWIVALWEADKGFKKLKKKYPKLRLTVLFTAEIEVSLVSVIEILKLAEPKVILTETEFDLPGVLGIINKKIPMFYLAQGYYNLPWYDLIGVNTNLSEIHQGRSENDFFHLPIWVSQDILAPEADHDAILRVKDELGLNAQDFVIGSFARMEKFTEPFLDFLSRILAQENTFKVILAGPNNNKSVIEKLKRFVEEKRAIILPSVDVNIVGHCLNIGLDTFPLHSGYAVLELMAKGIPVLSKKDKFLGSLVDDRLPETLKKTEDELQILISNLMKDPKLLNEYRIKTNQFIACHSKSDLFLELLDQNIEKIQNLRMKT